MSKFDDYCCKLQETGTTIHLDYAQAYYRHLERRDDHLSLRPPDPLQFGINGRLAADIRKSVEEIYRNRAVRKARINHTHHWILFYQHESGMSEWLCTRCQCKFITTAKRGLVIRKSRHNPFADCENPGANE